MISEYRMNLKLFSKITLFLFIAPIIIVGFISAIDRDKTVSEEENRALKQKPEFSYVSLMSGELTKEFDEYYSDTFPGRSNFMKISKKINALFSQNAAGSDNIVIINHDGGEGDFGGEALMEDDEWMKTAE